MVAFVNRQAEKVLIHNALDALHDPERVRFLYTPIVGFFGVEGIGKTAVLEYIEEQCKQQQVRYLLINAPQNASHFSREIIKQVAERYNIVTDSAASAREQEDPFQLSLSSARTLLEQGTVVLLLDSVDATNDELLERIALTLREFINSNRLFVAIASKKGLFFDFERSISRKLTTLQLKPIDRKSCEQYLATVDPPLKPETRKYIADWTHGYPLAMEILTRAVIDQQLDPARPEDQKNLLNLVVERVIDQKILGRLTPAEQIKYKELLLVLSVPRHFNLLIMQELIENFIPDQKRNSSLAYMRLPRNIKNDTGVLNWHTIRGGFSVDAPIRNILLLKLSVELPERYHTIHQFLARLHQKLATEVAMGDQIRYLCEYLYHAMYMNDEPNFITNLTVLIEKMSQSEFSDFETFDRYMDDFLQENESDPITDEEKEGLLSLIYRRLIELNKNRSQQATGEEYFYYLRNILIYTVRDPQVTDVLATWIPTIRDMLEDAPGGRTTSFVQTLLDSERLKDALGSRSALLAELVTEISLEG